MIAKLKSLKRFLAVIISFAMIFGGSIPPVFAEGSVTYEVYYFRDKQDYSNWNVYAFGVVNPETDYPLEFPSDIEGWAKATITLPNTPETDLSIIIRNGTAWQTGGYNKETGDVSLGTAGGTFWFVTDTPHYGGGAGGYQDSGQKPALQETTRPEWVKKYKMYFNLPQDVNQDDVSVEVWNTNDIAKPDGNDLKSGYSGTDIDAVPGQSGWYSIEHFSRDSIVGVYISAIDTDTQGNTEIYTGTLDSSSAENVGQDIQLPEFYVDTITDTPLTTFPTPAPNTFEI
ncbi:MAG: hypothetical protein LBM16_01180 [Clostridiales bacterium]|jgi:hypothetical protein|nr:hypothetical protein [Clostridiales bacterium]